MSSLSHHGIKGQRWGVRRFQNKDGTRTALGRKRQAAAQNVFKNQAANMLSEFKKNVKAKGVYGYEKTENEFLKHIENSALVERHNAYVDILNNENEEFAREALKNYYDLSEIHSEMNKMITDRRKTVHSKALDDDNNLLRSNIDSFYKEMTDDQRRKIDDLEELTSIQTMEKKEAPTRKVNHTSIGGTMYIEGNALILGDSSYLEHHGVLGQKWGVRRFQNKDGTRTTAGKAREDRRVLKKGSMVYRVHAAPKDYVYDNKKYVSTNMEDHNKWADYFGNEYAIRWKPVYYQRYKTKKDLYVATGKDIVDVVSTKLDKQMVKRDLDSLEKEVKLRGYDWDNTSKEDHYSMLLGAQKESGKQIVHELQKMGFGAIEDDHGKNVAKDPVIVLDPDKKLRRYGKTAKDTRYLESYRKAFNEFFATHTSIGGTMYIEGNALILGDSSYLEHHGIRGQRWGVRRFQNRDGSLTNAGRKRLGYATKGAVQTVGKAFKAGVKAGGNAVKAVKAHHEKKEAEKLQKKKEKASKTRLGVMANKDLFTNEEIKKLNERFKLEDEMKMATLQKGVEIAKAVGTIAQNVGTVAKTYEDVTGQSLSPIKRKAAEEKARQDKEDRERRLAREDAEEARKAAKEERDIAIHEQTLRKAIAAADTQEFTAQKTKAEADSSILDLYKKGQDFNGGSDAKTDATGKSWVDKATSDGKNPFDKMIYDRDPDYKEAKDAHDEKVARQERMKYLDERIAAREKEKQAEKEARDQALRDKINQSNEKTGRSKPNQPPQEDKSDDDGGGFAKLKEALPFDKGRYVNRKAAEKARDVKENAEEERTKKQDEKAAKAAIDTIIKDYQHQDDTVRSMNPTKYDREVAASVIKGKAKNALNKVTHPVDAVAKKISDKAREEKWTKERAKLFEEYQDNREKLGTEFANEAYVRAKKQSLQNLGYRGEALDKKLNETSFSKKKKAKHDAFSIQNGVLFVDSSDGLAHHGIRGQRWGVRRFQNPDGTLTAAGKKRDARRLQKELNSNDKKWAWESRYASDRKKDYETLDKWANKARSKGKTDKAEKYEKERDQAAKKREEHIKNAHALYDKNVELMKEVSKKGYSGTAKATQRSVNTGAEIVGMIALNTLAAAAGSSVLVTRRKYVNGTKFKVKYNENSSATHYVIENGTLFVDAGEPYLEHHGVKGMKWGKHLMAGKGEAGAGGGAGEDDEKLKEMAKKAGMSVAEFRTKMASKLGGAASKVSVKDKHLVVNGTRSLAVGETGEKPKSFKEKAYNALGGKYKSQAAEAHKDMVHYKNDADDIARRANAQGRAANANKKAGNVREYMANKEGARQLDAEAKGARVSQWEATEKANRAQWKYDHSIAGLYDKATGKYKQVHKRTKVPKTIDQAAYYYSEGPNSKLHNNGSSKAKTAKDQAKAAVWNAADHQIKAREHINEAATYGYNADPDGQAYVNASAREARLAEGSYRRAAALGKQASSETSTSSRPRARKKKHTSGGSGVTVRRPGRKPVARTKRVTQSSTGVKRRGATGTGARVRRGA